MYRGRKVSISTCITKLNMAQVTLAWMRMYIVKGNAQSMSIVIAIHLSCERSMHCNRSFTGVCFSYTSGDRVNGAV